jgi:catechol 2,3-dioxygenase-like lactoylglutathione lyase family enzyme
MIDHISVGVSDLDRSARFYEAALAPLGFVRDGSGFGPKDAPSLWLYEGEGKNRGTHVALKAKNHAAVDAFHTAGLKAGGKDNGAPGLRKDYSPKYYAAFLIDPDGNNVEAVCMS